MPDTALQDGPLSTASSFEVAPAQPAIPSALLPAVATALFAVCIVVAAWVAITLAERTEMVRSTLDVEKKLGEFLSTLQDAETGHRGYLLTGDAAYLQPYTKALAEYDEKLARLGAAVEDNPPQRAEFEHLKSVAQRRLDLLKQAVDRRQAGQTAEALVVFRTGRGLNLMEDVRARIARMQAEEARLLDERSESAVFYGRALFAAIVACGFLAMLIAGVWVRSTRRYARLLENAQRDLREANAQLETRVAERTAELQESNEEIQRFAYIVSHDLRAPLVNIMGFTSELEALQEDIRTALKDNPQAEQIDRDVSESLGFIKAAITKMDALIGAILKISREGRRSFRPEPVDLTALVRTLADAQRHQADEAGAIVDVRSLPPITGDRLALEQVFANLIDNAIKYLDRRRPGRIEVSGQDLGSRVRYSVRDNGRGIAKQDQGRVFELFRRAGAPDKPGEGIGLAHVRTLVRAMGGRIDLSSEPGVGTTFTVTLPKTSIAV